jgi:hypothetical protein
MKFYTYISDTKVNMLYPQIPKSVLKKIASSLSIDLKILGVGLKIAGKSNASEETRYAKVQIVSEYIEKHLDVGSIDAPSTYLKGTLPMQWGPLVMLKEETQVVFFTGRSTNGTVLGLGGSLNHVIGRSDASNRFESTSDLYSLLKTLETLDNSESSNYHEPNTNTEKYALNKVASLSRMDRIMRRPKQQLEFLAKTLLQGHSFLPEDYVVLGTPIYVALAD